MEGLERAKIEDNDPYKGQTTRSQFEEVMASGAEIPANFSDKAKGLLDEYRTGNLTEEDVKSYLDKKWLPETAE